jgi:hypothetical protein
MSLFRDISIVKTIAQLSDTKEVSEDACRMVLADTEIMLRQVVLEALKFMRHFNRDVLLDVDVNSALQNMRLNGKMLGMRENYVNKFVMGEDNKWNLENKVIVITDQMNDLEFEHFMNKHPVELTLDWLSINGNLVNSSANKGTICHTEFNKLPTKVLPFDTKQKSDVPMMKESRPNILSKEADKFLNSFFRILQENLENIRNSSSAKSNFQKFVEGSPE